LINVGIFAVISPTLGRNGLILNYLRRDPKLMRILLKAVSTIILGLAFPHAAMAETVPGKNAVNNKPVPVQRQFGFILGGAGKKPAAIGFYARGCLKGGQRLENDGPYWQAMRLSRNRHWGHPKLISLLKKFAEEANKEDGWPGLMVGDLSQPRGGPMFTGHRSHQIGLDADIWYLPMPKNKLTYAERENTSSIALAGYRDTEVGKNWTPRHLAIIKRAASYKDVSRIFVHPAVKKSLCDKAGDDRGWLRKVRPMWGHNYHFHIRMKCPAGYSGCNGQKAVGGGDGCGGPLKYWLKRVSRPPSPAKKPAKKKKFKLKFGTLAWVPKACQNLLAVGKPTVFINPRSNFKEMTMPVKRPTYDPVAGLIARSE